MADFKDTLKYVEKIIDVLDNNETKEYYTKLVDGIRNASGLEIDEADEARRLAQLNFNAISLANQVTFEAFASGVLTDALEKEYREIQTLTEAKEVLKEETDKAKAEEEELTNQLNEFRERGRKYDLVHAVCAGRSVEEAKKMQAEYDKQAASAMQGR